MSMQEAWQECVKNSGRYNLMGEYQLAMAKEFFEKGWLECHREARERMRKEIED